MAKEKKEKEYSIKTDFTTLAIIIIPVGVAINVVGGQISSLLKLPLYLDTIGTIFSAMLCGPWIGALAGAFTNIVEAIVMPMAITFIFTNIIVGLLVGFFARRKWFTVWWKALIAMIIVAYVSICTDAPVVVLLYGGVTGSGTSIITATAMAAGANIWAAVFGTEGIFTVLDRLISALISWAVIRVIPKRTLVKFGCGKNYVKQNAKEGDKTEEKDE